MENHHDFFSINKEMNINSKKITIDNLRFLIKFLFLIFFLKKFRKIKKPISIITVL